MKQILKDIGCFIVAVLLLFCTISVALVAGQKVCFYLSDKALEHKIKQEARIIESGFALRFYGDES